MNKFSFRFWLNKLFNVLFIFHFTWFLFNNCKILIDWGLSIFHQFYNFFRLFLKTRLPMHKQEISLKWCFFKFFNFCLSFFILNIFVIVQIFILFINQHEIFQSIKANDYHVDKKHYWYDKKLHPAILILQLLVLYPVCVSIDC